jgi:hypothetical protein
MKKRLRVLVRKRCAVCSEMRPVAAYRYPWSSYCTECVQRYDALRYEPRKYEAAERRASRVALMSRSTTTQRLRALRRRHCFPRHPD